MKFFWAKKGRGQEARGGRGGRKQRGGDWREAKGAWLGSKKEGGKQNERGEGGREAQRAQEAKARAGTGAQDGERGRGGGSRRRRGGERGQGRGRPGEGGRGPPVEGRVPGEEVGAAPGTVTMVKLRQSLQRVCQSLSASLCGHGILKSHCGATCPLFCAECPRGFLQYCHPAQSNCAHDGISDPQMVSRHA